MSTAHIANPSNLAPNDLVNQMDRTQAITWSWDGLSDDPYNYYAQTYRVRYKDVTAGGWQVFTSTAPVTSSPLGSTHYIHTWAANTFAAGVTYEWQVQLDDNVGTTDWSSSAYFIASNAPTSPVITAPAAGATINAATVSLTWTLTTQFAYRVLLRASAGGFPIYYDSGTIVSSALRAHTVPIPDPGSRTIELTVQNVQNGPWTPAVTRTFTAAGVVPATPTVTAIASDEAGCGVNHALAVSINNPTPTGGQPTVTLEDVYIRPLGSGDPTGTKILSNQVGMTGGFTLFYPSLPQGSWQVRAVSKAADGRNTTSTWATLSTQPNITGVVISDPANYQSAVWLPFNDMGTTEELVVPAEYLQFVGRKSPIVEFPEVMESRVMSIDKISIEAADKLKLDILKTYVRLRAPVAFRDSKGRRIIGHLEMEKIQDRRWGWETAIKVTEVDYQPETWVVL